MKLKISTIRHPQADGLTEIMKIMAEKLFKMIL